MGYDYATRIAKVRQVFNEREISGLLVTKPENMGYLTGFTGSTAVVVVTDSDIWLATDSRYWTQVEQQCPHVKLHRIGHGGPPEISKWIAETSPGRLGFEANHLTVRQLEVFAENAKETVTWISTEDIVETLRLIKDAQELAEIERNCSIAIAAWEHILPFIKPGAIERQIMLELEGYIRGEHRADIAFDSIVASGPRSALPHGKAADRVLQLGDFVTLDFGSKLNGYHSDITRTVVLGPASAEQKKVYNVVRDTLYRSIDFIKPGLEGKAVHEFAVQIISSAGYGDYFGHGLGHALGRAVHDGHGFSPRSEIKTAENMVITVEPGIYIPEWGGVRIEHDIVVTLDGCRILDIGPTELLEL